MPNDDTPLSANLHEAKEALEGVIIKKSTTLIMLFCVLSAGTLAFFLAEENWSLFDALYMTVITVTTVGYGEVHPLSSNGRIVAMVVLFSGLGIAGLAATQIASHIVNGELKGTFERRRKVKLIGGFDNHIILCDDGEKGQHIIATLVKEKRTHPHKFVVIDSSRSADRQPPDFNCITINGNPSNPAVLASAGIHRAAQVLVINGSDEENLSVAQAISQGVNTALPPVLVGVDDYAARTFFADRVSALGIKIMGFLEQACLLLVRELALAYINNAKVLASREPLIFLLEVDPTIRQEMLRALIMVLQISGDVRPIIRVFSSAPDFTTHFSENFPAASVCAQLEWIPDRLLSSQDCAQSANLVIFAQASAFSTLESAERFLLRNPHLQPHQVIACLRGADSLQELAFRADQHKRSPWVLNLFQFIGSNGGLITPAMEAEGKKLHQHYRLSVESGKDPGDWDQLPTFLKESNRMAALHHPIYQALWQRLQSQGINRTTSLEYLTQTEHMRWMAFHVMAGWRKDNQGIKDRHQRAMLKLHPDIVPFEQLDEKTKEYDYNNILAALDMKHE